MKASTLIPIVLLVVLAGFLVWTNWDKIAGVAGINPPVEGAAPASGPSALDKVKNFFKPPISIDPRKGSIVNPAGYLYDPIKNVASGAASAVSSAWRSATGWL